MANLSDQIIEVLDETDEVAETLKASGCSITPEVLHALDRVFNAAQRLEVTHFLFPPRSPDVEQLYRSALMEVVALARAIRADLDAHIDRLRAELAA
jgi:hypothetical protein